MEEIIKTNGSLEKTFLKEERQRAQNFQKKLNGEPDKNEVRENPYANKAKYLPISFVEMQLDEMFFGLWQTKDFTHQIVVNEVVGSIQLGVFHPVLKEWIWRTGAGATPIQMSRGAGITEVEKKIHNTLVKDFPHLKAECLKNAARSLGKLFGRDLNRKFEDKYTPVLKMPEDDPATQGQMSLIEELLRSSNITPQEYAEIENDLHGYSFNKASHCIDYLQRNQKIVGLETPAFSQTQISKAVDNQIAKEKWQKREKK